MNEVQIQLKSAAFDSFMISAFFAFLGIIMLSNGIWFGIIQIGLSLLNALVGAKRYRLSKEIK
jgi:putative Mn2+ efflux pump MntP